MLKIMIQPDFLQEDDTVGIISTARSVDKLLLQQLQTLLMNYI